MADGIETVLRLVAEGRLTADEAESILSALGDRGPKDDARRGPEGARAETGVASSAAGSSADEAPPRFARLEIRDGGRRVVDLRIPISLGTFALDRVPGLSPEQIGEVQQAIASNAHGPIVDVQDADGDGVRIILE